MVEPYVLDSSSPPPEDTATAARIAENGRLRQVVDKLLQSEAEAIAAGYEKPWSTTGHELDTRALRAALEEVK